MAKQYYLPAVENGKVVNNIFYHDYSLANGKTERRYRIVVSKNGHRYALAHDKRKGTKHITDLRRAKSLAAIWRDEIDSLHTGSMLATNRRKNFAEMIETLIAKGKIVRRASSATNTSGGFVYSSPNSGIENHRIYRLIEHFNPVRLDRIDAEAIKEFADLLIANGGQPMTAVRYVNTLNNIFVEGIAEGFVLDNPVSLFRAKYKRYFKRIQSQKNPDKEEIREARTRELSPAMLACHRLACWEIWKNGRRAAFLWLVMSYTGQRNSELHRALRQDLQLSDQPYLLIRPENQKSKYYRNQGKSRRVWLHADIASLIDAYAASAGIKLCDDGPLFPVTKDMLRSSWARIAGRTRELAALVGVPTHEQKRYTPYALRHTVASSLVKSAMASDLLAISMHLGHSIPELLKTYTHGGNVDIYHREGTSNNGAKCATRALNRAASAMLDNLEKQGAPAEAIKTLRGVNICAKRRKKDA